MDKDAQERLRKHFQEDLRRPSLGRRELQSRFSEYLKGPITPRRREVVNAIIDKERYSLLRETRTLHGRPALRDPETFRFRTKGVETIRANRKKAGWSRAAVIRDPKTGQKVRGSTGTRHAQAQMRGQTTFQTRGRPPYNVG